MDIKILGLADTHLKESNKDIVISIFEQALAIAKQHGLEVIYHVGDIFNSRKAQSQEVLLTFKQILNTYLEAGVLLVAIPGNHDKTDYASWDSFLDPFMTHPAFTLIKEPAVQHCNGYELYYIPYIVPEKYIEALEGFNVAVSAKKKQAKVPKYLLTHIDVNGAVMNNGTVMQNPITTDHFKGFDQVIIGHYHDRQLLGSNICFVGASLQHNFGEDVNKGMWGITHKGDVVYLPLDFPQYITRKVDVSQLKSKDIEFLTSLKTDRDHVRVILQGDEASIKGFNKEQLMNKGIVIKLEPKPVQKIEDEPEEEIMVSMSASSMITNFKTFCKEKELDSTKGLSYLTKALELSSNEA